MTRPEKLPRNLVFAEMQEEINLEEMQDWGGHNISSKPALLRRRYLTCLHA